MTFEIQFLAWDRHNHVAWLNLLIESPLPPLDDSISNVNTYIT